MYLLYCLFSAGAEEQVKVRDAGDGVYECEYYPLKPGKYTVSITWGGHPIPRRLVPVCSPQVFINIARSHLDCQVTMCVLVLPQPLRSGGGP